MLFLYFLIGSSIASFYMTRINIPLFVQAMLFMIILAPYFKEMLLLIDLGPGRCGKRVSVFQAKPAGVGRLWTRRAPRRGVAC